MTRYPSGTCSSPSGSCCCRRTLMIYRQKNKKGRGKSDSVTENVTTDDVFTEELQLKIQENARLQSELSDVESHYSKRITDLENKLEGALQEVEKNKNVLQDREKSANEIVDQLESERVRQEVVAQQKESELRSLREQNAALLIRVKTADDDGAKGTNKPLAGNEENTNKMPNLDIKLSTSNLQIPVENGQVESPTANAKTIVDAYDSMIQEFCSSFAQFLCTYSTRIKLYDQVTGVKEKLIDALNSAASPWHSLAQAYHQLAENASGDTIVSLETLSGLTQVSRHVTACAATLRKVLPLVVHWVSEGSRGQVDGDRIGAAWSSAFSRLVSAWGSVAPYVSTLANQSKSNSNLPPSAQGRVISMLSDRLNNLHAAFKEAEIIYQKKAISEEDLPSTLGEAKAANIEIIKVLESLSFSSGKMTATFKEQVLPSWSRAGSSPSTPSTSFVGLPYSLSKSKNKYTANPQEEDHCTSEDSTLVSPSDSANLGDTEASLMKQLALASSKLSQLEAEREHWRLEHQLLQCKYQKEAKRVQKLESQMKGETRRSDSETDNTNARDHSSSVLSTSMLGEVQGADCAVEEREKDIRNHFTSRCSHLYMQLTSAASQATLYQNECEILMRRLAIVEENRTTFEQEVDKQRENTNHLKETLQTTSRNYEEQISTMSEHLADLNEKLTAQAEYIEQLKYEIKNKKGKK